MFNIDFHLSSCYLFTHCFDCL